MGLFGGGNSKRTTNNIDRRIINDYSGATFDNSQTNEIDNSIAGNNNNNQGTINITDGGAFDLVDSTTGAMASLSSESLSLADSMAGGGFDLADSLGRESMALADSVAGNGFNLADSLGRESMALADSSINQSLNFAYGVTNDSMSLADSLGAGAFSVASESMALTDGFMDSASNLAVYGIDAGVSIADTLAQTTTNMLGQTIASIDNANARNLDAALAVTQAGVYQSELGFDFARDLAAQNGDAALMQQQDNNSALNNGFKSMMQFADSVSRSDGAGLAQSTNKMFMVLGGAAALAFIVAKWG